MAVAIITSFGQQSDSNGVPLNAGTVTVYSAGTTTPLTLYPNSDLTGSTTNPITLDSSGRHAMAYIATASYKILVKNSAGTTIYTRDNIDPGVSIGAGALAVLNGGTGATSAASARTNLAAAASTDMATAQSDIVNLQTWTGYNGTAATRLPVGTTAQRPTPTTGHIRRNSTLTQNEIYNGSGWEKVLTDTDVATQANMETATSTTTVVTPGRVQNHPGVAKAYVTITAGGTTIADSYNVTSITRTGSGDYTVNFTTAFSSANYAAIVTCSNDQRVAHVLSKTTSACRINTYTSTSGTVSDPSSHIMAVFFGDQ